MKLRLQSGADKKADGRRNEWIRGEAVTRAECACASVRACRPTALVAGATGEAGRETTQVRDGLSEETNRPEPPVP